MKPFDALYTSRTTIRRFKTNDRDKLIELLCDQAVTRNMAFPEEMLTKEGVTYLLDTTIQSYDSENPLLSFAVSDRRTDTFLGVAGFKTLQKNEIEIFYAFLPKHWGKGYATEVLTTLTDNALVKEEYSSVIAPITRSNKASIRVVEKQGFTHSGLQEHPDYKDLVYIFEKRNRRFRG